MSVTGDMSKNSFITVEEQVGGEEAQGILENWVLEEGE